MQCYEYDKLIITSYIIEFKKKKLNAASKLVICKIMNLDNKKIILQESRIHYKVMP
jgi:hypothetical protein